MEASKKALRLASSLCLLALAGCSGGGGGGGAALNTGTNNTPSNTGGNTSGNTGTSGNTTPTPTVSIGAPDNANVTIQGAPAFNFTTNLPAVGTVFGLLGPAVQVTSTTVSAANKGTNGTITYRGMTNGVPIFDVSVPAIGLTASNVRADGTTSTLGDGSKVVLTITTLNYTAAGAWAYTPASGGTGYIGATTTGSGTPIANVPIAGSASYTGSGTRGGVAGAYFVPNGTGGISLGSLSGDIAISVNFTSGSVTGTLSNMTATPAAGGTATPWNSVSLSANVNRLANNASFTGTTGTSGAPAGAGTAGFSSAATGQLGGAFFGPNADEAGGTWTLTDPDRGRRRQDGVWRLRCDQQRLQRLQQQRQHDTAAQLRRVDSRPRHRLFDIFGHQPGHQFHHQSATDRQLDPARRRSRGHYLHFGGQLCGRPGHGDLSRHGHQVAV